MGILNVTPDSFSDGGHYVEKQSAVERALQMVELGADFIDIGGESTRPGAEPVSVEQELERVIPIIEGIVAETQVPVSIDTSKAEVMAAAVAVGAGMVNDVCALSQPGALQAAASLNVPVCLMHMQGEPRSMQHQPSYTDVVSEVEGYLLERVAACESEGIDRSNIILDPGFGFGKNLEHNTALFRALPRLADLGFPLLVGVSRKSMLGLITGQPVEQRLIASVVATTLAAMQGALILRVHDVEATVDALKVYEQLVG